MVAEAIAGNFAGVADGRAAAEVVVAAGAVVVC